MEFDYEKNIKIERRYFAGTGLSKYTLMDKLHLDDTVIINVGGIQDGTVEMITQRGVSVYTSGTYLFVKWCNVISKRTKKQELNWYQKLKLKFTK